MGWPKKSRDEDLEVVPVTMGNGANGSESEQVQSHRQAAKPLPTPREACSGRIFWRKARRQTRWTT